MGRVQFSDATSIPRKEVHFWQLSISRRSGKFVHPRHWHRAKKAARIKEHTKDMDLVLMKVRLKDATLRYRAARKSHQESRLHFIESFDPKQGDRILRAEEQRRQGRMQIEPRQCQPNPAPTQV